MICTVILGPTLEDIDAQIRQAILVSDLVELRLDYFVERDVGKIKAILNTHKIPMIFTLRSKEQGGSYCGSEQQRLQEIKQLITCLPSYFDLESHIPEEYLNELSTKFPTVKLIISHHDFSCPSKSPEQLLSALPHIERAIYKVAMTTKTTTEALQHLIYTKSRKNVVTVCMGIQGQISRILSPVVNNPFTYACLNEEHSTMGQLTAQNLSTIYRYHSLKPDTLLFGLFGDPVTKSISHYTHNATFEELNLNAVYIKMRVEPLELKSALALAGKLGFKGLSITMPLKESIVPLLDELDEDAQTIGAVNTVTFLEGRTRGSNKDGLGALDSLEKYGSVKGKRMIILGAGGAARAIAYEAIRREAFVTILNRTKEKARLLAQQLGCEFGSLESMKALASKGYDLLVNCTPNAGIVHSADFIPNTVVLDVISNPKETNFLKMAKNRGCKIVYGYEMFIEQAYRQFQTWFPEEDLLFAKRIMHQKAIEIL